MNAGWELMGQQAPDVAEKGKAEGTAKKKKKKKEAKKQTKEEQQALVAFEAAKTTVVVPQKKSLQVEDQGVVKKKVRTNKELPTDLVATIFATEGDGANFLLDELLVCTCVCKWGGSVGYKSTLHIACCRTRGCVQ